VFVRGQQLQVLDPVVADVAIDVVDVMTRRDRTVRCDPNGAVFKHSLAIDSDPFVRDRTGSGTLRRRVARLRAVFLPVLLTRGNGELGVAAATTQKHAGEVVGSLAPDCCDTDWFPRRPTPGRDALRRAEPLSARASERSGTVFTDVQHRYVLYQDQSVAAAMREARESGKKGGKK
jgi:hypothetical protein